VVCLLGGFERVKGMQPLPPFPPGPHNHSWAKVSDLPKPMVILNPTHVRQGDVVQLQVMMTSDTDICEVYWPPCSFPGNKAQNRVVVKEWHADVGGTFGRLDEKGNFVPEGDPTKVTHYKPPKGYRGYVSITVKIDDIPRAVDPATGEEVDTHNDEPPAVSDPAKLTVWEFEIDPPYIDARPVDQYREGQALYTFTATFEPGVDHNGNPMVTQIEFRLNSSREPGFCINATREEGSWTDTTANDNDLKFVPNQTGLEIRAPEGTTNYNQAIYIVPQPPPSTVTVSVRVVCLDYGAHGSITAIAYGVPSPKPPIARWKGTLIQRAAQIPKDQRNGLDDDGDGEPDEDLINGLDDDGDGRIDEEANGNGIWDGWEFEGPARDDNDAEPQGDGTLGDGLSRYEEYRGVMVSVRDAGEGATYDSNELLNNTFWTELNPRQKDMFVAVFGFTLIIRSRATIGYFPGAGMPPVHILHQFNLITLLNNDLGQVNFYSSDHCQICNFPHRIQGVYAALIYDESGLEPPGPLGETSSHIWSPPVRCYIYTRRIEENANRVGVDQISLLFLVIGHELGHTVICPLDEGHIGMPPPDCGHHNGINVCLMNSPWRRIVREFCDTNPGCQRLWRLKRIRQR
jgi:hypothetical protein